MRLAATTKLHCIHLGLSLRPSDVAECRALGLGSIEAVYRSWRASTYCTTMLTDDGRVVAIGGLVVEPGGAGQAWLLTSGLVHAFPFTFHREVWRWLGQALGMVRVVWTRVDARYVQAVEWLRAMGFEVRPAVPYGPAGVPFHLALKEAPRA